MGTVAAKCAPWRQPQWSGNYLTATFRPELSFTVDGSWILDSESPVSIRLSTKTGDDQFASILVVDVDRARLRALDPPYVSQPFNVSDLFEASRPLDEGYLDWLRAQPTLDVGAQERTELGGLTGSRASAVLDRAPDGTCRSFSGACFIPVLASADSTVEAYERGVRLDASLLDAPGGRELVLAVDPQLAPDRVEAVLDSLRFGRRSP